MNFSFEHQNQKLLQPLFFGRSLLFFQRPECISGMKKTHIQGDFYESLFGDLNPCGNLSLPKIENESEQQMFYSFVRNHVLEEEQIKRQERRQEKWYIFLDGYSSTETDIELLHYNGEKIQYKNFAHGDNIKNYDPAYTFATIYGHGWTMGKLLVQL